MSFGDSKFYINGIDNSTGDTFEYNGGEIKCRVEKYISAGTSEYYNTRFILLVDGVPCEFTVDGETAYIHFYKVESENVFDFSFVPKTSGGDRFTVNLIAVNSTQPYFSTRAAIANVWAMTVIKCADSVKLQQISEIRKPDIVEPYENNSWLGISGKYFINGVSNGSSERAITITEGKGFEVKMNIKYTYKSDEKPILVLMLNNRILDVCDLSHENSSIKAEIKFVIPPEKVESGEMTLGIFSTGKTAFTADTWIVYRTDRETIDDCSITYDDEKLIFNHSGDGCVFIITHTPNDPLKLLRKPIVYSFSGRDADAALVINGSQYRNATIQTYSHENGIYRFTRRVITPYDK